MTTWKHSSVKIIVHSHKKRGEREKLYYARKTTFSRAWWTRLPKTSVLMLTDARTLCSGSPTREYRS